MREKTPYPLCDNCIHYQGCHSTLFGPSWSCGKNYEHWFDVSENDWNVKEEGKEPVDCPYYDYGEHLVNVCIG